MTDKYMTPMERLDRCMDDMITVLEDKLKCGDIAFTGANAASFIKSASEYITAKNEAAKAEAETNVEHDPRYNDLSKEDLLKISELQDQIEAILNKENES